MNGKRSLAMLLGATVSASAGLLCFQDEAQVPLAPSNSTRQEQRQFIDEEPRRSIPSKARRRAAPPQRALSRKELGVEQSFGREVAHWISAATVYAAAQAFYASSGVRKREVEEGRDEAAVRELMLKNNVYHGLFGWLQELQPMEQWDAMKVIQSSSFNMLLNLISGAEKLKIKSELEAEMYRVVSYLATNAQCAKAIAERSTRYGKHALLNLAQLHDIDPRVGQALHRMVVLDGNDCRFGPANLVSLVSLAIADVPEEYQEFAFWALGKAASTRSQTTTHEWRKSLFGGDSLAKTRRTLISNERLWDAIISSQSKSEAVQFQVGRLLCELSENPAIADALRRYPAAQSLVLSWLESKNVPLVCLGLDVVAKLASNEATRSSFLKAGALETVRKHIIENTDCRMTASLLHAVRAIAAPLDSADYALDDGSLSFLLPEEEHPLHHDDLVHPSSVSKQLYVDGWIELFTNFLKSEDSKIRTETVMCLHQLATHGAHRDQCLQEWLIAVLDGVLSTVPLEIARASTSVRDARSRTRPLVGYEMNSSAYESSHAKALRALAFVLGRKECQQDFVERGGVPLIKSLLTSTNVQVNRELARVLANLFTCDDLNEEVKSFALLDEELANCLTQWTQSDDLQLQSIAHRAHSNLRYQKARAQNPKFKAVKYLDGVHPLHLTSSSLSNPESVADYDVDVVFIHGLLGCPYETWVCGEGEDAKVWAHDWLLKDLKEAGHNPRVLSIGYDSQLLASESVWRTMCFNSTSQEILKKLENARVGMGDRPVVFVTHSLGGVLVKQVLLDSVAGKEGSQSHLLDYVNGVVFYGVPHHGSPIAQRIQAFRPQTLNTLGIEQHPVTAHLHGTPHLTMLNEWCKTAFIERNIPALSLGETVPCRLPVIGIEALVVPPTSANPNFGDFQLLEDSTHIDVCKPQAKDDPRYSIVKDFILASSTTSVTVPLEDVDVV